MADIQVGKMTARPCPFCGWEPDVYQPANYETDQGTKWGRFICGRCLAKGPEVRTGYKDWRVWGPEAVAEWNSRSGDKPTGDTK